MMITFSRPLSEKEAQLLPLVQEDLLPQQRQVQQQPELQQEAAFARLKAAQTDYNKALESGNQAEIERTQIALQTAQSSSVSAD